MLQLLLIIFDFKCFGFYFIQALLYKFPKLTGRKRLTFAQLQSLILKKGS
jgi:hypothetical protein